MILNTSEAAAHLGYRSRTTLQRLLRSGYLDRYRVLSDDRQVLLETDPAGLPCLRDAVRGVTQVKVTSPLWLETPVEEADDFSPEKVESIRQWLDATCPDEWKEIAEIANNFLDLKSWTAPPWSGREWQTLAMVLNLAQDAAGDA